MNIYEQFMSKNPKDVLEVYDSFKDKYGLINFLKDFPEIKEQDVRYYETQDESDIVVAVATGNYNSELVKRTKELYKGLKIVFIESNGIYFNTGTAYNRIIKKALEHSPKWIVLSNDDMTKVDDISILKERLESTSNDADKIYRLDDDKKVHEAEMGRTNHMVKLLGKLSGGLNGAYLRILDKFDINLLEYSNDTNKYRKARVNLLMQRKRIKFPISTRIWIFNGRYAKNKKGMLFDRMCRNGCDDLDMDFMAYEEDSKYDFVNFNIGHGDINHEGGKTLGLGTPRVLRALATNSYFCEKWKDSKKLKALS